MSFSSYKSLGETVKEFQIQYRKANFVQEVDFSISDYFREDLKLSMFGITSNGDRWQFGKLEGSSFTLNSTFYTIQDLDRLFSAVNYVFQQCEIQLNALIAA